MASSSNGADARPARKTAIVTGGASGIGLAMSQHFASQGYDVAVFDVAGEREADALAVAVAAETTPGGAAAPARVVFRRCDVSSWRDQAGAFRAVHEEFGRVDVVCANAGISERGTNAMAVAEGNDDEPREPNLAVVGVNLTGVIFCECFLAEKLPLSPACGRGLIGYNSCQTRDTLHEQERASW